MARDRRRFPIQDRAPDVSGPRTDDEVIPDERRRRNLSLRSWVGTAGLVEVSVKDTWLPDSVARNDAVASVEWRSEGWIARWTIARQGHGKVARALHLEAEGRETPDSGITADMLRSLSPAQAVAASQEPNLIPPIERILMQWAEHTRETTGPVDSAERTKPGRPRVDEDEVALVALAYLEEAKDGRGVHRRLAARFHMAESTVRDRISMARSRGYLTPTKQGRRGAEMGELLAEWMRERGYSASEGAEE
jgi:hypothetical protein